MATCMWAVIENAEANAFKLASILGNESKDPREVVDFLKTIPATEIVKVQRNVLTSEVNYYFILFYFILSLSVNPDN